MSDLPKIFIATTSETMSEDWFVDALTDVNREIEKQRYEIDLQPWDIASKPGDITAETLIERAHESLGAIVVLTGEDYTRSRGEGGPAPRDNLIFEAGLFICDLGLKHVLLLREKDTRWPSDLHGVEWREFVKPSGDQDGAASIRSRAVAKEIRAFVNYVAQPIKSVHSRALRQSSTQFSRQSRELKADVHVPSSEEPTRVRVRDVTSVYLDAVNSVRKTFATTTYLESNFWTSQDNPVKAANESMLERVKAVKGGSARRLILLPRSIQDELEHQRIIRRAVRAKDPENYEQIGREYRQFASANRHLIEQGFLIRVVYDRDHAYSQLPDDIGFEPGTTELALYDSDRVDSFSGFTSKNRAKADVYLADKYTDFKMLQKSVQSYFDTLWESDEARDFSAFDDEMQAVVTEVDDEIDYTRNWLYQYDEAGGEDGELKVAESDYVIKCLEKRYRSVEGAVSSHIDLGACTGRYVEELQLVRCEKGRCVAIDSDSDCIDMMHRKKQSNRIESYVEIRLGDIRRGEDLPNEKFDLVTCMMGTLCHLTRNGGSEPFEDEWQTGLQNVAKLLASDGDAFIAVWSKRAPCDARGERRLLDIYEPRSNNLLYERTPPISELERRVAQANMKVVKSDPLKGKLRVLHLRHAKTEVGR